MQLNNTFSYLILGVTTTIAGGYSRKAGHTDGPAQNATFSDDFDLLFMHKMCSLLISDRGSGMIRQMDLKPEDCEEKPKSSKGDVLFQSVIFFAYKFSFFSVALPLKFKLTYPSREILIYTSFSLLYFIIGCPF